VSFLADEMTHVVNEKRNRGKRPNVGTSRTLLNIEPLSQQMLSTTLVKIF